LSQTNNLADDLIVIIDYGSGNLRSAEKSFMRQANGRPVLVSGAPDHLRQAAHIVLPGVGAFGDCAQGLRAIDGMVEALQEEVLHKATPFLGICVGMQLMCRHGLERAAPAAPHDGLGWFAGAVRALDVPPHLKVPHMGWNEISADKSHPVIGPLDGEDVYFVHGFGAEMDADAQGDIAATTDYGGVVTAALARDNMIGVQFHPEKSQAAGLALIERFLEWRP
jgi:glutamine amidotransferase